MPGVACARQQERSCVVGMPAAHVLSSSCSKQGFDAPGHRRKNPCQLINTGPSKWNQWVACVRLWLQEGTHPCSLTIDGFPGMSALSYAVTCSENEDVEELVGLLLQHGAHPLRKDAPPAAPRSPMQYADQLANAMLLRMFRNAIQPQPVRISDANSQSQQGIHADRWKGDGPGEQQRLQHHPGNVYPASYDVPQRCTPDGHHRQHWHTLSLISPTVFTN
jgi:hypothetical protein